MHWAGSQPTGGLHRLTAKRTVKPINFHCVAAGAASVAVVGDFNGWDPNANPMRTNPDGSWSAQIALHHGHHHYQFLVDGKAMLDPRAQGIARNARNERVSIIAVS